MATKREIFKWITINGAHVPIYEDYSVVSPKTGIEYATDSEMLETEDDDFISRINKQQKETNLKESKQRKILSRINDLESENRKKEARIKELENRNRNGENHASGEYEENIQLIKKFNNDIIKNNKKLLKLEEELKNGGK